MKLYNISYYKFIVLKIYFDIAKTIVNLIRQNFLSNEKIHFLSIFVERKNPVQIELLDI